MNQPIIRLVEKDGRQGIECLNCHLTSWNQNDVEHRYCGNCHQVGVEGFTVVTSDAILHHAFRKTREVVVESEDLYMLARAIDVRTALQVIDQVVAPELEARAERGEPPAAGEDLIPITPQNLRDLAREAPERFDDFIRAMEKVATAETTELVRFLRCEEGFSWRAIAGYLSRQGLIYWHHSVENNQIAGMAACCVAAAVLGQDYREPPWNQFPETIDITGTGANI